MTGDSVAAEAPRPGEETGAAGGVRPLRVVSGLVLLVVPLVVAVLDWSAITTGHPAYPLTLLASAVLGAVLLVTGSRRQPPARAGGLRTVLRVLALLAAIGTAALLWWLRPLHASDAALAALQGSSTVSVSDSRSETVYRPVQGQPAAGLVLYPGGKVDPRAYAVLASGIAARGYEVVVPKCAYDLALLCPDAASAYVDDAMPWAVGGHSLGGVTASAYAAAHPTVDGLVLWAAYPQDDMSGLTSLRVASVSGSADGLATPEKVAAHRPLLPASTTETVVQGGIHSFFGDYGLQPGDGTPTVSREAAQAQIVDATVGLLTAISGASAA